MTKHRVRELSQRTIDDHNIVHAIDNELRSELGDIYNDMSRGSIYRRIAERLPKGYGYCEKQIAFILNHTRLSEKPTT
jgi:hypothetical protein